MKKLLRAASIFMVSILLVYALTGCQIIGLARDVERKQLVKEVLQERYGEEFVVTKTWTNRGTSFFALAYPERDKSLLFDGLYKLQEGEPPYTYDHYDQAIIAKQLKEIVQADLETLFGECYINATMMGNSSKITNVDDITIENYVATAERSKVYFEIGINADVYTSTNYRNEYDTIVGSMQRLNDLGVSVTVENYFIPRQNYQKFITLFQNDVRSDSRFDDIVDGYPHAGMAVIDGDARQTYEEYLGERKELSISIF